MRTEYDLRKIKIQIYQHLDLRMVANSSGSRGPGSTRVRRHVGTAQAPDPQIIRQELRLA
jgi:hypothetical protein